MSEKEKTAKQMANDKKIKVVLDWLSKNAHVRQLVSHVVLGHGHGQTGRPKNNQRRLEPFRADDTRFRNRCDEM